MIDHLLGRPSPSWKRTQVFLVIFFWLWRIKRGNAGPPRFLWLRNINRALERFTPWQIIVSTLTALYAVRNLDNILGLGSPEPLARLYSPSYYRATWISTGLDAGFATAMSIRPKWLRDLCSILFSGYYILYAHEGDEKLRRYRAVPTVEMLRTTWEKTTNPFIRMVTYLPSVAVRRKVLLPRPKSSQYQRPITAYLFFHPHEHQLCHATELILDFPGGGFVAMSPEHHEERLRTWAVASGKPVLSIDYGKAPEYPYPFAIDEAFDAYKVLVGSAGTLIGMSGKRLNIIISGDSAGATLAINVVMKVLEYKSSPHLSPEDSRLPQPLALVFNYAALDFNFTSWMSATNLQVLRSEQSSGNLPGLDQLAAQKDHLQHISPLSMVKEEIGKPRGKRLRRSSSWKDAIRGLTKGREREARPNSSPSPDTLRMERSTSALKTPPSLSTFSRRWEKASYHTPDGGGSLADSESDEEDLNHQREEDRPIRARVRYTYPYVVRPPVIHRSESTLAKQQQEMSIAVKVADTKAIQAVGGKDLAQGHGKAKESIGTRLTMTSRTGYFQDRIVSPSMMRAMAILYIGPHQNPDFATDYHISPILAPTHLLAQFPPLLMQCGEKDPFVDDTVIFAGRVREAKRARKVELDLAISGKSARFGEALKMSDIESSLDGTSLSAIKKERDRLARETEDDWVQMVLFSDWSHGYLQMPTLMSEAKVVIEELAEWMNDAFSKYAEQGDCDLKRTEYLSQQVPSETEADDSGITFVPKRHHNGSPALACDDEPAPVADSDMTSLGPVDGLPGPFENSYYMPIAPGSPKSLGSRQAGTVITETELMRRRRLLDAHIFE